MKRSTSDEKQRHLTPRERTPLPYNDAPQAALQGPWGQRNTKRGLRWFAPAVHYSFVQRQRVCPIRARVAGGQRLLASRGLIPSCEVTRPLQYPTALQAAAVSVLPKWARPANSHRPETSDLSLFAAAACRE